MHLKFFGAFAIFCNGVFLALFTKAKKQELNKAF
nr:MAG TPA: hypothetical protein [Caudoviricetes sp.]